MLTIQDLCKRYELRIRPLWLQATTELARNPHLEGVQLSDAQRQVWNSLSGAILSQGSAAWVVISGRVMARKLAGQPECEKAITAVNELIAELNTAQLKQKLNCADAVLDDIAGQLIAHLVMWRERERKWMTSKSEALANQIILWLLRFAHANTRVTDCRMSEQLLEDLSELIDSLEGAHAKAKELPALLMLIVESIA